MQYKHNNKLCYFCLRPTEDGERLFSGRMVHWICEDCCLSIGTCCCCHHNLRGLDSISSGFGLRLCYSCSISICYPFKWKMKPPNAYKFDSYYKHFLREKLYKEVECFHKSCRDGCETSNPIKDKQFFTV